ncbi:MAG: flagellar biosynthetic protein FliQ [Phycisphaeraceae bacterium]|nr:flagellar biosynthetic protein FliQ [Phycisphaerales bacterium]MCB9842946.1 flagellar biosynthetic protein FliQ [Phycisphaeraceae bacterium]
MLISAPVLLAGVFIGLVISIVQSVTQIQEQTLSMVPKIFAMTIVTVVLLPWITAKLIEFAIEMLTMH